MKGGGLESLSFYVIPELSYDLQQEDKKKSRAKIINGMEKNKNRHTSFEQHMVSHDVYSVRENEV